MTALPRTRSEDIVNVSLHCNHMCFSCCYSFSLFKTDGKWFFSAECSDAETFEQTKINNCPVESEKVQKLLSLVEQHDLIDRLNSFCMPPGDYTVCDMTTCSTALRFANGASVRAGTVPEELKQFFFALAKEYV